MWEALQFWIMRCRCCVGVRMVRLLTSRACVLALGITDYCLEQQYIDQRDDWDCMTLRAHCGLIITVSGYTLSAHTQNQTQ